MPTTEIKSIKPGGGGDYASLNAWYAAEVTDLVAADKIKVAEVYGGGNALTGQLQMTTWTTDATRFVIIRAATGHQHAGVYDETKAYGKVTGVGTVALENRADYTQVTGMQFKTDGAALSPAMHQQSSPQGTVIDQCILWATGAADCVVRFSGGGGTVVNRIRNSIVLGLLAATSIQFIGVAAVCDVDVVNNTIIGGAIALAGSLGATIQTRNNYMSATMIYTGATYSDGTGDATSNAEAAGTGLDNVAYSTVNFINVTDGTENLHIQAMSVLHDGGVDSSSLGVTTDIDGATRALPYDVGADEYSVSSASSNSSNIEVGGGPEEEESKVSMVELSPAASGIDGVNLKAAGPFDSGLLSWEKFRSFAASFIVDNTGGGAAGACSLQVLVYDDLGTTLLATIDLLTAISTLADRTEYVTFGRGLAAAKSGNGTLGTSIDVLKVLRKFKVRVKVDTVSDGTTCLGYVRIFGAT